MFVTEIEIINEKFLSNILNTTSGRTFGTKHIVNAKIGAAAGKIHVLDEDLLPKIFLCY